MNALKERAKKLLTQWRNAELEGLSKEALIDYVCSYAQDCTDLIEDMLFYDANHDAVYVKTYFSKSEEGLRQEGAAYAVKDRSAAHASLQREAEVLRKDGKEITRQDDLSLDYIDSFGREWMISFVRSYLVR